MCSRRAAECGRAQLHSAVAVSKLRRAASRIITPSFISRTSDRSAPPADLADPSPISSTVAASGNHVWAYDFVFDSARQRPAAQVPPKPSSTRDRGVALRRHAGLRTVSLGSPVMLVGAHVDSTSSSKIDCVRRQAHRRLSGAGEGWYKNDPPSLVLAHRQRAIPLPASSTGARVRRMPARSWLTPAISARAGPGYRTSRATPEKHAFGEHETRHSARAKDVTRGKHFVEPGDPARGVRFLGVVSRHVRRSERHRSPPTATKRGSRPDRTRPPR